VGRLWRAYDASLAEASAQDERRISGDDAHHLRKVLRLSNGERLELFDGQGRAWVAEILSIDPLAVTVRLLHPVDHVVEATLPLTLFQARLRGEKMEWVLQKATELGLRRVVIFDAELCDAPPIKPNKLERWRRIVLEASKQSGRTRLLEIETAPNLELSKGSETALILDPELGDRSPASFLPAGGSAAAVWLAVGPESGFSAAELDRARSGGWQPAALGARILRTEGAGLVAATILLHQAGDLGTFSPV
jgi:16S rRNA (uracil1498-N3)-methyltransferase